MLKALLTLLFCLLVGLTPAWGAPTVGEAAFAEGVDLYKKKSYAQAFYSFDRAKKAASRAPESLYYQGLCYYGLGNTDHARTMLKSVVNSYPLTPSAAAARQLLDQLGREPGSSAGLGSGAGAVGGGVFTESPGSGLGAGAGAGAGLNDKSARGEEGSARSAETTFKTDRAGRMLINVLVNNTANYPMLLDTGADVCTFSVQQAEKAGIDMSKSLRRVRLGGVAGEASARVYRARLQVGKLFSDVDVYVQEGPQSDYALLGRSFLANLALEVDDTARTVRFTDQSDLKIRGEASMVPYRTDGHGLFVTAKINGRECEMVLDTGCSTTNFTDKQWSALGMTRPTNSGVGSTSGLGGSRSAHFFNVGNIELGGVIKYNVPANVSVYGTNDKPLLGMSFLQGLKYTIDPFNRRLYLSK